MNLKVIIFILPFLTIPETNGYRILAFFPFHGRSHFRVLQPIAKALASKGHQVDVISHFPLQESLANYTDIVQLKSVNKYATIDYKTAKSDSKVLTWILKKLNDTCDYLGHPKVAKLIQEQRKNLKYDLLLLHDLSGYQCLNAIGYVWKVPIITVVTTALYPWMHKFIDNPANVAISPMYQLKSQGKIMTFWERLNNVYRHFNSIYHYYQTAEVQQYYINKYFSDNVPHYRELEKSVALVFTNSHYTFTEVKPKSPALIEVAGIHIQNDSTPMNMNLKTLLDDSKNGFIYLSLGSMVLFETFPLEILEKFYSTFHKIAPMPIIVRVANSSLLPRNLPKNVFVYPWLPQQKILSHPNIKAFVSHGGALGTQEAVHFAVPMICMPIFAEQNGNCNSATLKNIAITLNFETATQEEFDQAFQVIIHNSAYKESVRKLSKLFNDRPRSPADEVVYWTEYIIRHGASALRSPAAELHWWQIELLDIYAFIFACLALVTFFIGFVTHLILKRLPAINFLKLQVHKKIGYMKID